MTDAAGPPGPVERFSSLPIREADAAVATGADRSELIVRCDMAQAFDIPTGTRTVDVLPPETSWLPRQGFQIAFQAGPAPQEYGSVFGSTQARQTHPAARSIPSPAIPSRLINSGGFDKTTPASV